MRPIAISLIICAAVSVAVCAVFGIFPWLAPIFLGLALAVNLLIWLVLWIFSLFVDKKKVYEKPSNFYRRMLNFGYAYICEGARVKIKTSGTEKIPEKPFLLVSNHLSQLDNMIQCLVLKNRPLAYITKESLFKIPIVGRTIWRCCYMPIDRKSLRAGKSAVEASEDYIRRGVLSVGVFPEGTRGDGINLGKFHAGSFKIALKTGCPIVVSAVRGTKEVHKRTPWRSTKVTFDIIDVIDPAGHKSVELSELVRGKISAFLESENNK